VINFEHKKIIDDIIGLESIPEKPEDYAKWVKPTDIIEFLIHNSLTDEKILFLSSNYLFIDSLIVSNRNLSPIDKDDLLKWSLSPTHSIASYVMGGGREDVWLERGITSTQSKSLEGATRLIYMRTFEGFSGEGKRYFELLQEYSHLCEIHWRPERHAYCRFNENGDFDPVVTISTREDKGIEIDLVTFKWKPLEEYLVVSDSSLVRFFDFTLYKPREFSGWPDEPAKTIYKSEDFFYRQLINPGLASYTRGVQIVKPKRSSKRVYLDIKGSWDGKKDRQYAEYIAFDWRNEVITKISTHPEATCNYFNADGNSKPFEVSPAFFNPEVLSKYKADKDKYKIGERDISCRGAWYLKGYDVNDAGQIHAYICDLRSLPYKEQLHWQSHNEEPKTSISERAYLNDFKNEWVDFMSPLQTVLSIIQRWHKERAEWWTIRNEKLMENVTPPLTDSRDEWAESFMDLSKLIVEGFPVKIIREKLDTLNIVYEQKDMSIALLEKMIYLSSKSTSEKRLAGLRTVQRIRSKVKSHPSGSEAKQLVRVAIKDYGSFRNHYQYICSLVADELYLIEKRFLDLEKSN